MHKNEKGGGNSMNTDKKGSTSILTISIVLISMACIFFFGVNSVSADQSSIYVNDSSGNDEWNGESAIWDGSTILGPKKTISNAVTTVTEDGTVNVAEGTYTGSVTVNKKVTIQATGTVTVQSPNSDSPVFIINLDGSGSTIKGFQITGATNSYGIYLNASNDNVISENTITGNSYGIQLQDSSNNEFHDNTVENSANSGFNVYGTSLNNNIYRNNILDNIGVWFQEGSTVSANVNFNRIICNGGYGIINLGSGVINGDNNWWGTNFDGTSPVDANIAYGVDVNSWIILNINTSPAVIPVDGTSTITADLTHNSNGEDTSAQGHIPDGIQVTFDTTVGTIEHLSTIINGIAQSILSEITETADVSTTVDDATKSTSVTIADTTAPTVDSVDPTDGSTTTDVNQVITVNFSEDIQAGDAYESITVKNASGVPKDITKSIEGNVLTITVTGSYAGGVYTLDIPVNGITDLAGNGLQTAFSPSFTVNTLPDLTITSITTPTSGIKGSAISITDSVENHGTMTANGFTVRYMLSTDAAYGNDYLLGDRTISSLNGGASNTATSTFTIPTSVPIGTYYILAYADRFNTVTESNETNNIVATPSTMQVLVPGVDLIPTSISGPTNGIGGNTISVTDTVKNQGATTANSFTIRYLLSSDNVFGSDYILGDRTISSLNGGASNTATSTFTIPTSVPIGTYYILAYADRFNTVTESNETNNILATSSKMQLSGVVDLIPTSISGPTTGTVGNTISITDIIRNSGTQTAPNFTVRYVLSTDAAYGNDYLLGDRTINSLSGGTSNTATSTFTILTNVPAGTYYILVYVDRFNTVTESNETNNILANTSKISVSSSIVIDLIPTSISGPTSGTRGSDISITDTIQNEGNAAANNFTVRYVLSTDAAYGNDYLLGDRTINSLSGGTSNTATSTFTILTNVPAGTYYILVYVDRFNIVNEPNETNNILATTIRITVT